MSISSENAPQRMAFGLTDKRMKRASYPLIRLPQASAASCPFSHFRPSTVSRGSSPTPFISLRQSRKAALAYTFPATFSKK
jgi:hypothetical protein